MVRTKQTKRRKSKDVDDAVVDEMQAEVDGNDATPDSPEPEAPKNLEDLHQMVGSQDKAKHEAAGTFISEKLASTKEIKEYFQAAECVSSFLQLAIGSKSKSVVGACCNIVRELPAEWKELRESLATGLVEKDLFDGGNIEMEKNEHYETCREYGSLLSSCFRSNSKKESECIMTLWINFLGEPSIYYAYLIHNNQYYWNIQRPQEEKIRNFLSSVNSFLENATAFPVGGEKKIQSLIHNAFSQIINRVIQWSCAAKNFENEILSLFETCKQDIRPGWIKIVEGRDDCYTDTEYENSDDDDEAEEDSMVNKNAGKPLSSSNMTLKERVVNCTLQQLRHNYEDYKLISGLINGHVESMIQRISEVFAQEPEDEHEMKEVRLDPITNLMRSFVLGSVCLEHPKAGSKHSSSLIQLIKQHPDDIGLMAAAKMYPYDSTAVNTYMEQLFEYCKKNHSKLFVLLETVARYDESGSVLEQEHVDHLDSILVNNVIDSEEITDCLATLQTIAESRPELLMGKGEDYYDVILRVGSEPEQAWSKVDSILKCRAFINDDEAAAAIALMIDSVATIPANSHIANVLETLQTIAIVNKSAVKPFRSWICEQGRNAYLKKNVVKLLLVLDGPSLNSGGAGSSDAGAEKSSSTCTIC